MTNLLRRMFDHMAWADDQLMRRLEQGGAADPAVLRLLAHVVAAEHVWLSRIQSRKPAVAVWPDLDVTQMKRLAAENTRGFATVLAEAGDEGALAAVITYETSSGQRFETPLADILLHVALHGSHHRGQVALVTRGAGAEPLNTDFITWSRAHAIHGR